MTKAKPGVFFATAATAMALSFMSVGAARAECRLTLTATHDNWVIRFDPYNQDMALSEFDLLLTNEGSEACIGTITTDSLGEPFGLMRAEDGTRIHYSLSEERSGTDVTPRTGISARRVGNPAISVGPGGRELVRFSLLVSPDAPLGDGEYTQSLSIGVASTDGLPLADKLVRVGVEVPAVAVMGLKGAVQRTSNGARIDLGELSEGRRALGASLYVLSTRGYVIGVSSDNRGQLRFGDTEWMIPYSLNLGGHDINLATGGEVRITSRRPRADDYGLSIVIGNMAHRRAGEYADTVRFSIAPI